MNQKPINAKGTKEINLGDLRVYENVIKDAIKCSKESDDKIIDATIVQVKYSRPRIASRDSEANP